jgi:hypothetical protein
VGTLFQLCAPMLDRLKRLPVPQREALRTAFGMSVGPAPDRFLVGLADLSLEAVHTADLAVVIEDCDVEPDHGPEDYQGIKPSCVFSRSRGSASVASTASGAESDALLEFAAPEALIQDVQSGACHL